MADMALLKVKFRCKLLLDGAGLEPDQDKQELVRYTRQCSGGFRVIDQGPLSALAQQGIMFVVLLPTVSERAQQGMKFFW